MSFCMSADFNAEHFGSWPLSLGTLFGSIRLKFVLFVFVIVGGGLPVGSLLLIEEDLAGSYAKLVLKYFLAEGVYHRHSLHLTSLLQVFTVQAFARCTLQQPDQGIHFISLFYWYPLQKQFRYSTHQPSSCLNFLRFLQVLLTAFSRYPHYRPSPSFHINILFLVTTSSTFS